ncbi:MAG: hypothetical protein ACFFB3_16405 [Candidatus Hodarchaeota archaeon]
MARQKKYLIGSIIGVILIIAAFGAIAQYFLRFESTKFFSRSGSSNMTFTTDNLEGGHTYLIRISMEADGSSSAQFQGVAVIQVVSLTDLITLRTKTLSLFGSDYDDEGANAFDEADFEFDVDSGIDVRVTIQISITTFTGDSFSWKAKIYRDPPSWTPLEIFIAVGGFLAGIPMVIAFFVLFLFRGSKDLLKHVEKALRKEFGRGIDLRTESGLMAGSVGQDRIFAQNLQSPLLMQVEIQGITNRQGDVDLSMSARSPAILLDEVADGEYAKLQLTLESFKEGAPEYPKDEFEIGDPLVDNKFLINGSSKYFAMKILNSHVGAMITAYFGLEVLVLKSSSYYTEIFIRGEELSRGGFDQAFQLLMALARLISS